MEKENPESVKKSFLNSCQSARNSIDFWPAALRDALADYHLDSKEKIFSFILKEIEFIETCEVENLGYRKGTPYVYGYVFRIKLKSDGIPGYLAFFRNPKLKDKIKWIVKSLHKDQNKKYAVEGDKNGIIGK